MSTLIQSFRQFIAGRKASGSEVAPALSVRQSTSARRLDVEIAPDDPILAYFQGAAGAVELDKLELESPGLRNLRAAGVKLSVPLIAQGELIGLLNLGPRLSEQEYSIDDRRLLNSLAIQAAPALRVAQLVRQQQAEALERERLAQEMRVARIIQQTLLPDDVPLLPGWQVSVYWQPARAVGGDFYDFISLPDGRLAFVIGDVTDKGVPAALVMATTRSILRATTEGLTSPGQVLEQVNNLLHPDIPPKMFVTCLFAVLDPVSGRLCYANAGHCLPYRRNAVGVHELRATGMPLGLLPGMTYEEKQTDLLPGDSLLFYSDGLIEAHSPEGEMFGIPRVQQLLLEQADGHGLIELLLGEMYAFTGDVWEQEDDATFLVLERSAEPAAPVTAVQTGSRVGEETNDLQPCGGESSLEGAEAAGWRTLADIVLPSVPGNEREAAQKVSEAAQALNLPPKRLEQLQTAVAEGTMNAIEHGNQYRPDLPVAVQVLASEGSLAVRITDCAQGGDQPIPDPETPDLEAKLSGLQTPRGWGLFLIEKMVDEMNVISDERHHTLELILYLKGGPDADQSC